jgi:hypothetical protein
MEAGLTDPVWNLEELCVLMPKPTDKASTIEAELATMGALKFPGSYVPAATDATVIVSRLQAPTIRTRSPATRFNAAGSPSRR